MRSERLRSSQCCKVYATKVQAERKFLLYRKPHEVVIACDFSIERYPEICRHTRAVWLLDKKYIVEDKTRT